MNAPHVRADCATGGFTQREPSVETAKLRNPNHWKFDTDHFYFNAQSTHLGPDRRI
jgi:hypothetical protein